MLLTGNVSKFSVANGGFPFSLIRFLMQHQHNEILPVHSYSPPRIQKIPLNLFFKNSYL